MDCVSYTVEAEVPPDLAEAATCTTAFFKVTSALDQLEEEEAFKKHTLFATRRGHLVEAVGGTVQRSTPAPKDVNKIVVHHDFEPLQLYVVLLCTSEKAVLLAYADFKVLREWEGVVDIGSVDTMATGSPQLVLTKENGRSQVVSNTKLMSYVQSGGSQDGEEEEEGEESAGGKKDAVQALMHRFKGGMKHAQQLRNERRIKENFIAEELENLRSRLKGRCEERQENLVAAVAIGEVQESAPVPSPGPIRVLRVSQNLVHDKWVIMVNVYNEAERMLVSELQLSLFSEEGPLHHTSQVLKSVKHFSPRQPGDARATINHLDPLILRPKKRATVVGVCDIPSFRCGPSVTCSGLLCYAVKPLKLSSSQTASDDDNGQAQVYQVSISPVALEASQLHLHVSSWDHCASAKTVGVSFGVVALVAASYWSRVSLTSLVSPLNGFLTKVAQHHKLIKESAVSDFYVLHPKESHPLQHTAFILHAVDAHTLNLDLFTRDEKQAMILAHSLLAALPKDTSLQVLHGPSDPTSSDSQPLDLQHMLLARIREAATLVSDTLEARLSNLAPKTQRREAGREPEDSMVVYTREREELLARKGDIVFEGHEYRVWRKKLQGVMSEVDDLYLKYLRENCA